MRQQMRWDQDETRQHAQLHLIYRRYTSSYAPTANHCNAAYTPVILLLGASGEAKKSVYLAVSQQATSVFLS